MISRQFIKFVNKVRYYCASNDIHIDLIIIILIILVRYTRQSWQYCHLYIEFLTNFSYEIFIIEILYRNYIK